MHIVFAGLPGVGKTTIARELSKLLRATYLRIDSLEQALARAGAVTPGKLGPGGYHAAAALAVDNLRNGMAVVTDSVNPWPETRQLWREASRAGGARCVGIEVVCSDMAEHRRRVESREADIVGHILPDWHDVQSRGYLSWDDADLHLDTARLTAAEAINAVETFITGLGCRFLTAGSAGR